MVRTAPEHRLVIIQLQQDVVTGTGGNRLHPRLDLGGEGVKCRGHIGAQLLAGIARQVGDRGLLGILGHIEDRSGLIGPLEAAGVLRLVDELAFGDLQGHRTGPGTCQVAGGHHRQLCDALFDRVGIESGQRTPLGDAGGLAHLVIGGHVGTLDVDPGDGEEGGEVEPVSYTHLDVYKR